MNKYAAAIHKAKSLFNFTHDFLLELEVGFLPMG